jgi:hypothetical protein
MTERKVWINSPDGPDHQLWRYMDFLKFVDLLQRRALWFTRLDQLLDLYEGSLTKPTVEFLAEVRSRTGSRAGVQHEKFRKVRCVNCWHMNDYESAAMWELYSKNAGVAIRSRISRLEPCFPPEVTGGSWGIRGEGVQYVDYENDLLAGETSEGLVAMAQDFTCKRKSFEHEREYRLVTSLEADEMESVGKFIPVALERLIERIVVSPNAPKWVTDVVRKESSIHGLNVEVVQSDLFSPLLK